MTSYENTAISCSYPTPFLLSRVNHFLFYISDYKTFIILYLDFSVLGIIYWPPGKMKNYIFSTSHSKCTHRHTQTCQHTHRTQTLLISFFFSFIRSVLFIFLFLWYFNTCCRVSYGYFPCIVQMLALPGFNYYLILLLFICSVFYSLNIHSISDIPQIILGWPKRCSVRCYRKIRMKFLANPILSSQCLQIYFIFYNFNSMKKAFPKPSDLFHSTLEAC